MDVDLIMPAPLTGVSTLETSASDFARSRRNAIMIAALILAAFAIWLGVEAPRGTMWGTDELLTAERSREMLVTGERMVVHYNFHRSFEKPPLQYWLTSFTLPRFDNRAVAVRIWPLFYAVLTCAALGWLVSLLKPDQPWLIPLTIALLISSPLFSTESSRGLLDIGLSFFTVLTIAFAELARKSPKWWLAVALACWLGSLQKMPVPFLLWILIVGVRLTNREERIALRAGARWLIGAMLLAAALILAWPLLQIEKYEMSVQHVYKEEVTDWLGPNQLGRRPYFEIPISLILHPGGLCGLLSLIALFVILFSKWVQSTFAIREIAMMTLAFLVLAIVSNFRDIRYVIPALPALCFLLGLVIYRFLKQPPPIRTAAVAALVILLTAGIVHAKIHINHRRRDVSDEKMVAEKLGELQRSDTKTILIKAIKPGNDLLWDSFYLFHGNLRSRAIKFTPDEIRANRPEPPLVGACVARDFPVVKELYPSVEVELTRAQFVCWSVPAQ
jgi:4-amino-4-deoxy-L-arabinose transferase-like glycosyltransferase